MRNATALALAAALFALAFQRAPEKAFVAVWEAENPAELIAPMRAALGQARASGGGCIELPLGSGQGWRGAGTGHVTYRVDVPHSGAYRLWARTMWQDGCTNAFFLSANEARPVVFGNDAVFKKWHWVKGQSLLLNKGVNLITFSNHSDGTALDKVALTDDPFYAPQGLGDEVSSFYDGFAGCDADNSGSWEFVSGDWRVVKSAGDAAAGVNGCLAQWESKGGTALAGYTAWHDYDMRVRILSSGPGTVGLVFFHIDSTHEGRLIWQMGNDAGQMRLERADGGNTDILATGATASAPYDRWYEIGFRREGGRIVGFLDGVPLVSATFPGTRNGQIGLLTEGCDGVYFDNVDVRFER